VPPLLHDLDVLRKNLDPEEVTVRTLPQDLVREWLLPDGRARVQALPKGDPNDTRVLRTFATAVLAAEPTAAGGAISLYEAARTVTTAFIEAGALAIVAIAILLFVALRRVTDVLLTLIPLLLAGVVTLEICALDGLSLNFANIIALPLLLGRRSRLQDLLHHGVARRKNPPAAIDADPGGDLQRHDDGGCVRQHVGIELSGMSSMGKLMALALACTMAAAVLFQPVLRASRDRCKPIRSRSTSRICARLRNESQKARMKKGGP